MHSSLNRLQAVFGFFTSVALFVAGVAALSVLLFPADDVTSELEVKNVQVCAFFLSLLGLFVGTVLTMMVVDRIKGRPHYYSNKKDEFAHIRFDLEASM